MPTDHDTYVARGFCPEIYTDDDGGEHWCRLQAGHEDWDDEKFAKHVAPWAYEFPKQETMVRWDVVDGAPTDVEWLQWEPD